MLTFGNHEIDETRFPSAITARLLQRAVAHILGNEVASSVLSWEKRSIADFTNEQAKKDGKESNLKATDVSDAMLQVWRENETVKKATEKKELELRNAKIAALYDGTLSVRTVSAPTRDPVEAACRAIAKSEIVAILKNNKLKFPGKDETIELAGQVYDADALIEARLANEKEAPRIKDLAVRKVREDKRLKDAVAKGAAAATGDSVAASLGL